MTFQYPEQKPVIKNSLHELFGHEIELLNDTGEVQSFNIKLEFSWGDATYVALQSEEMKQEDEVEFLRVIASDEEVELESIDDEEWEAVSEAYDDLLFSSDERP